MIAGHDGYPTSDVQLNDLDHARLRRLAQLRPGRGKVLSLYLDLDPGTFPTQPARAAEIGSLLDEADRRTRNGALDRPTHVALREDLARVRAFLHSDELFAKGAHAVALFACGPAELFEVLRLPDAVPPAVVVDDAPWIGPLVGREQRRRCLALVSRRALRVLLDTPAHDLREVADLLDEVHGRHDQGGMSQARYARSIEQDVHGHVERAAHTLFSLLRRDPFDLLAVGASAELWPELERALHPYLRERTLGRFDVDVEHARPEQALAAAQPLLDAAESQRVGRLLGRLVAGLASGDRAVAGPGAVLAALSERRVAALLYEDGFRAAGFACAEAAWVGVDANACPQAPEHVRPVENVLDLAIAAALLQGADVVALRERPELGPHGGIASVLRF